MDLQLQAKTDSVQCRLIGDSPRIKKFKGDNWKTVNFRTSACIFTYLTGVLHRQPPTPATTRFPAVVVNLSRQQTVQSSSPAGGSSNNPSAATITLLAVSFYLIATTLPVTICYVLYLAFPEGDANTPSDPAWGRHHAYLAVRRTVEELAMSKYACNFYIYLTTGTTFRRELCRLLRRLPVGRSCRNLDVVGGGGVAVSGTRSHYTDLRACNTVAGYNDARLLGSKISAL
jgi:hypothetical protein